jgi:hypothetical protein
MSKWEKYKTPSTSSGRWDKYKSEPQVSALESGLRGAAQGATFGLADEATGALEALFTDKSYEQARDESRQAYKSAEKANPNAYLAGDIAGGVATAFIPGLGVLNAGKGAKLAEVAGKGALQGALGGFGRSEGDAAEQLQDTAAGALLGGATGAVASKAGDLLGKTADTTQDVADRLTIRSLGGNKGQIEKLGSKAADVAELVRSEGIVTPMASSQEIAERAAATVGRYADETGPIYAQSAASKMPREELLFKIDEQIEKLSPNPGNAPLIKKLQGYKEAIYESQTSSFNPSDLRSFRQSVDRTVNFNSDAPSQIASKNMRGILRDAEMGQIEKLDPALRSQNEGLFRKIHLGSLAEDMAESGAARSAANNEIGLNSWQAGIMGAAATGEPVSAVLSGLGRELTRRYGDQMGGILLDKIAKAMKNPAVATAFEKAAQRGPNAVLALYQAMQSKGN